jgi:hypothetical protein
MRKMRCVVGLLVVLVVPAGARGQQRDSTVVRDSIARADSIRADSVRRGELARIRGEPRATVDSPADALPSATTDRNGGLVAERPRPVLKGASLAGDMIADLSPKAAARPSGSRIRLRDIEGSLAAGYGPRLGALLTVTLTDDGMTQRVVATDAAVSARLPVSFTEADLIVGATALPFGRSAQLHRHALLLPDQPLPVRVLLGETGLRGTGVQLRSARALGSAHLTVDLAVADRFGARIDSLHPGEPPDQSLAGVAAGGRAGLEFGAIGTRVELGVSSISGKREQPIGCVYDGTVGPVPCPEAVNAANTRLTVLGADARAGWWADRFVVSGEWMRMVVGATDLPVFSNDRFAPFYRGVHGTYDGGYVDAKGRIAGAFIVGGRADWLQNPEVGGLNDAWAGGFAGLMPFDGTQVTVSYQRRLPSSTALAAMTTAQQDARDRIVLRGTVVIGRHPGAGRD